MPYKRRYKRRRRYNPKKKALAKRAGKPWYQHVTGVAKAAFQSYAYMKMIQRMKNDEKKYFDVTDSGNIDDSGTTFELLKIPSTTDATEGAQTREGKSLKLYSIQGTMLWTANTSSTRTRVKCMLVADLRPSGTQASITDILESASPEAFLNKENSARFVVLKSWYMHLVAGNSNQIITKRYYIPLNKTIYFADDQTDDPNNYNLLLVAVSSEDTNTPTLNLNHRVRFYDA